MSWQFIESMRTLQGCQFPSPTLRLQAEFRWEGNTDIEISSARLSASIAEIPGANWPEMPLPIASSDISPNRSMYVNVALPVERRFIEAIENWRSGRSVPIRMEGHASFNYRPVESFELQVARDPQGKDRRVLRTLGPSSGGQARFSLQLQRDQWLEVLKGLGWNEFIVFEMAVRPLVRHERFKKAFELLDHAQVALRQGQWASAATDSRKAVEAAATAAAPDGDQRARFDALLAEVLPDAHDGAKRAMLGNLMVALRDLRNEAAHANSLLAQVEREDAELAFGVAVAVFRYIGESMGRNTKER
ncbi:MAG: hypothetical protein INH41_20735 [Myxococcaceae bacterium]|jgi:hypothetical protein|nr:hypothetical protein [Myxococcaceae bacterium]